MTEISDKNILNDIIKIVVTKQGLNKLKIEYHEEFKHELIETVTEISLRTLEDYFGLPLVVSKVEDEGKEYQLFKKI